MRKEITILIIAIMLLSSIMGEVSAAKTVFITCDNIINHDADIEMLNSIKEYVEEISNGELEVVVDSQAPGPGEGTRAILSSSDVSVNLAAACAGNLVILAKYSANSNKQTIFVNTGDFDLDNASSLRRAWDDDYSSETFAGINSPGDFLKSAGIDYIQPLKQYPDAGPDGYLNENNDEVNRYIAQKIVEDVESYSNSSKTLESDLIINHKISVSSMASASKDLINSNDNDMNGSYGGYTAPQLLYLTSSYLNGNGISTPSEYDYPDDAKSYSVFAKDSYSIYDYMKMGGLVKEYMDENGKAPNYLEYDGAQISYYDLVYNFAKITQNHTDMNHMNFDKEYHFDKVNSNILLDILPFIAIIVVILIVYTIIKRKH